MVQLKQNCPGSLPIPVVTGHDAYLRTMSFIEVPSPAVRMMATLKLACQNRPRLLRLGAFRSVFPSWYFLGRPLRVICARFPRDARKAGRCGPEMTGHLERSPSGTRISVRQPRKANFRCYDRRQVLLSGQSSILPALQGHISPRSSLFLLLEWHHGFLEMLLNLCVR